jgi:formylglycine-generating enzyme required for sulfatase activity
MPFDQGFEGARGESRPNAGEVANWAATPSLAHPDAAVTGVSWYDAEMYCQREACRLPTIDEALSRVGHC